MIYVYLVMSTAREAQAEQKHNLYERQNSTAGMEYVVMLPSRRRVTRNKWPDPESADHLFASEL